MYTVTTVTVLTRRKVVMMCSVGKRPIGCNILKAYNICAFAIALRAYNIITYTCRVIYQAFPLLIIY